MEIRFDEIYNNHSKEDLAPKNVDTSLCLYQGTYNDKYCTLEQIGSGAFGCVKSAFRRSDKKMVIKFLLI